MILKLLNFLVYLLTIPSILFLLLIINVQKHEIDKLYWSVDTQYRVYKKQHELIKKLKNKCEISI